MGAFAQRFLRIASPIASAIVLVLLPKCPVCLAAYVMMATGIGISVAAAASLRAFVILVCVSSFVVLVARQIRRLKLIDQKI